MRRRRKWIIPPDTAARILAFSPFDIRIKTAAYTLQSPKINAPVRLAVIADLHGCRYGEGMGDLLAAVRDAKPDAVLIPGDFYDDCLPGENTRVFARAVTAEFPVFYAVGNHEFAAGHADDLKAEMRAFGASVLAGQAVPFSVRGETLWIAGADDPYIGEDAAAEQRKAARAAVPEGAFSILISHRPELTEEYAALGFDAVVTGHAHGGQWRIPGILNGVYAPHQGIFPRHAGGMYDLGATTMIVSRGLARETTPVPRIFNRPELVVLEIR